MAQHAPEHGQELITAHVHRWKMVAKASKITPAEGRFIPGVMLVGIRDSLACPVEPAIASPRFAEHSDPTWRQDTVQFSRRQLQIEMMQDRIAPDPIEGCVREGEPLHVANQKPRLYPVGVCPYLGFAHVAG